MPATTEKKKAVGSRQQKAETNGHDRPWWERVEPPLLPSLRIPLGGAGEACVHFSLEYVGDTKRWQSRYDLLLSDHEKFSPFGAVVATRREAVGLAFAAMEQHLAAEKTTVKNAARLAILYHVADELRRAETEVQDEAWDRYREDIDDDEERDHAAWGLPEKNGAEGARASSSEADRVRYTDERMQLVPLHLIAASPFQPVGRTGSDDAEIATLAESIVRDGLGQPVQLRRASSSSLSPLFPHKDRRTHSPPYELIDGERRVRAVHRAGLTMIRAIVEEMDDAAAATAVGIANIQRKSWTALDKGAWLERLTKSVAEGGLGLTQSEAGKLAGGISQGEVSNLIRLHQGLTGKWRQRVISGEIPATFARDLLPYLLHPPLAAALEKACQAKEDWKRLDGDCSRDEFRASAWRAVSQTFDDVDEAKWIGGAISQQVRLSEAEISKNAERLAIVEVGDEDAKGKKLRLATNTKLFAKLLEKKGQELAAKRTKGRDKKDTKQAEKKKTLSAAEVRAKEKKQAEQLAGKIADWRRKWIRKLLREEMEGSADAVLGTCGAWLLAHAATSYGAPAEEGLVQFAVRGSTAASKTGQRGAALKWEDFAGCRGWQQIAAIVGELVWPARDEDRVHPSGTDALYPIPDDVLEGLALAAEIDLAAEWTQAQACKGLDAVAAAEERKWISGFLDLHNREQLVALTREAIAAEPSRWKHGGVLVSLRDTAKRSDIQAAIEQACFASPCPLPKSIAPLKPPRAKKKKGNDLLDSPKPTFLNG